jgi:hypothetical protein
VEKMINTYKLLVRKLEGNDRLGSIGVYLRMLLGYTLRTGSVVVDFIDFN